MDSNYLVNSFFYGNTIFMPDNRDQIEFRRIACTLGNFFTE